MNIDSSDSKVCQQLRARYSEKPKGSNRLLVKVSGYRLLTLRGTKLLLSAPLSGITMITSAGCTRPCECLRGQTKQDGDGRAAILVGTVFKLSLSARACCPHYIDLQPFADGC